MEKIVLEITPYVYLEGLKTFDSSKLRGNVNKILQLAWTDKESLFRPAILTGFNAEVIRLSKDKSLSVAEKKTALIVWVEDIKQRFSFEFSPIGWYDLKVAISRIQDTKKVN